MRMQHRILLHSKQTFSKLRSMFLMLQLCVVLFEDVRTQPQRCLSRVWQQLPHGNDRSFISSYNLIENFIDDCRDTQTSPTQNQHQHLPGTPQMTDWPVLKFTPNAYVRSENDTPHYNLSYSQVNIYGTMPKANPRHFENIQCPSNEARHIFKTGTIVRHYG